MKASLEGLVLNLKASSISAAAIWPASEFRLWAHRSPSEPTQIVLTEPALAGQIESECSATFNRNRWPHLIGKGDFFGSEYAAGETPGSILGGHTP